MISHVSEACEVNASPVTIAFSFPHSVDVQAILENQNQLSSAGFNLVFPSGVHGLGEG